MEDCFPKVADNAFRAVVENMAQGAVILTAEGFILYANRSFSEMAKSPLDDLIGASIYDFVPVENRTTLRTILQKDGKAELFLVSEDERWPVCASTLQISEIKGAKCLMVTDLMEQKRNDAIVAAERLAGSIIEQAAEGIVVCDHSGKILHCSLAAAEICGQDPTLQSFDDVFDLRLSNEEGTGQRISPISASFQGNILFRVEVCLKRKDSKQFLLLLNAGPIKNQGAVIGCVVALSDITELKNAKDNLARANERLKLAQEAGLVGTFEWNLNSGGIQVDGMESAYGDKSERSVYAYEDWLKRVHSDDIKRVEQSVADALAGKGEYYAEYRAIWPDGSVHWVEARGRVDRDSQGRPMRLIGVNRNITEHKLAEEALQKSKEMYRTAIDFTCDWETWLGPNGDYIYISPSCETITGYIPEEFFKDPDLIRKIVHPDYRKIFPRECGNDDEIDPVDFRIISRTGEERWISHICQPVYSSEGRYLGRRASNRDITKQKQIEQDLRKSEARFRSVLDNSRDVIYRLNIQTGSYEYISPSAETIVGFSPNELIALDLETSLSMIHPDDLPAMRAAIARMEDEGNGELEYRQRTKNGEWRWISNRTSLIKDSAGRPLYRDGNIRDITERKQFEKELKEGRDKLTALFELLPVGISIIDENKNVVDSNPALEKILDITRDELLDGKYVKRKYLKPDGSEMPIEEFPSSRALKEEGIAQNAEIGIIKENGIKIWIEVKAISLPFPDWRVVLITSETTERKLAEEELRKANALLEAVTRGTEVIIAAVDLNLRYTFFNESYKLELRRLTGKNIQIGMSIDEAFAHMPEQQESALHEWNRALHGESANYRIEFGDAVRYRRIYDVLHTPLFDANGNVVGAGEVAYDITEQAKAEEGLRRSEERYRSLFNSMSEGFALHEIICDEIGEPCDYRFLEINPAFEQLTGLQRENVIGRTLNEILPDEDPYWIKAYGEVALTGKPARFENFSHSLNRHFGVVAYSPAPQKFAVVFMDVTDQKLAEASIANQNLILMAINQIHENTMQCDTLEDLASKCLDTIESAASSKFGFISEIGADGILHDLAISDCECALSSMQNKTGHRGLQSDLVPLGLNGFVIVQGKSLLTNDPLSHPEGVGVPQGHLTLTAFLGVPLMQEGRAVGMIGLANREGGYGNEHLQILQALAPTVLEAIQRRRAEDALKESEERLQNIFQASPVGIFISRLDGGLRLSKANDAYLKIIGYSEGEAIGHTLTELNLWADPQDRAHIISIMGNLGRLANIEIRHRRKNGEIIDVSLSMLPIEHKGESAILGTLTDITARKHMEGELRESRDELEKKVRERTAELSEAMGALEIINRELRRELLLHKKLEAQLTEAKAAAEAAAEAKASFMANMSHELRTPMNAVIGMTSLLLDDDLTSEQRDFVETIRNGGDSLLSLINDILDFSRLEKEKTELENQAFHLQSTIEEALDLVAAKAAEKRLNLAYALDKRSPDIIVCDPIRLRQILANLLDNAIKFTQNGEVLLSVSSQPAGKKIELHFAVKDSGIGIPPDKIGRLFESFSQVDNSIAKKYGGTGLGLAICKKLVELMGGRIWVESEVDQGSTFHFKIPVDVVPVDHKTQSIEPKLKGKRILIVEDNKTNRRLLRLQAREWGMIPTSAGSSREALRLLKDKGDFDVAILEIDMPKMDGLTLAREIRKYNKEMQLVILAFAGRHIESDLFNAALTKPIKPSQFYNALLDIIPGPSLPKPIENELHSAKAEEKDIELSPLKILLVEDNVHSQKVTLNMLKKLGFQADAVANGLEALQALERQHYDLVLMDIRMPEMNGLDATQIIRRLWPNDGPTIIAITAYSLEGDREKCLEAGMDDYISKPVKLEDLENMLRKHTPPQGSFYYGRKGTK